MRRRSRPNPRAFGAVAGACAALALLQAGCAGPPREARPPAGVGAAPRILTIVGTNDLHGHVEALPLLGGYVAILRRLRARDGGAVLLLDGGDMFQGTLESNLGEGDSVVAGYNALDYTAVALGNHEFDFGPVGPAAVPRTASDDPLGALKARARQAHFPFLSANVLARESGQPWRADNVSPSVLRTFAGVSVGIIGGTTMAMPATTMARNVAGLTMRPLAEALASEAAALRARGATVVLVTAHAGAECAPQRAPEEPPRCHPEAEIIDAASALPPGLVDAIVAGHSHTALAHQVNGIPIIEAGSYGRGFARVDLIVDARTGRVQRSRLFPMRALCAGSGGGGPAGCEPGPYEGERPVRDPAVANAIAPGVVRAAERRAEPLGVSVPVPVRRAYRSESTLGNLVVDLMRASRSGADVALTNAGGLREDLDAGPLTYGAWFAVLPFDNVFARVRLTAARLASIIATNLQRNNGILSVSGVRARAACADTGLQVQLTREDGRPLNGDEPLVVLTSDFLATGGDHLFEGLTVELEEGPPLRDVVANALRAGDPAVRAAWARATEPSAPRLIYPGLPGRPGSPGSRPVRCPNPTGARSAPSP